MCEFEALMFKDAKKGKRVKCNGLRVVGRCKVKKRNLLCLTNCKQVDK
jgi:hypothetical protein